ncbi:MAG: hypothetical protein AAFW84_07700 [Cyanobacteria bacterium J06635_15]
MDLQQKIALTIEDFILSDVLTYAKFELQVANQILFIKIVDRSVLSKLWKSWDFLWTSAQIFGDKSAIARGKIIPPQNKCGIIAIFLTNYPHPQSGLNPL